MNRPVDHVRRGELLARIVEYALEHGVTSLTLRPAAEAAGTSGRMLIHHFGSRDAMVAAVVLAIEERLAASVAEGLAQSDPAGVLRQMWIATAEPRLRPLVRAVFETWGRALVSPGEFGDYLQRIFTPWRDALAAALEAAGEPEHSARSKATLATAAFNGLQLARLTSPDDDQVDVAFEMLCRQFLEVEKSS